MTKARYDPELHHRRSIRLRGYDYRDAGAYFVTIVTHDRESLFGEITDGQIRSNEIGQIVAAVWARLSDHFRNISSDEFVVMPNHVHGIIVVVHEPDKRWDNACAGVHGRGEALADAPPNRDTFVNANASPLHPSVRQPSARGTTPRSLNAVVQNFKSVTTRRIHKIAAYAERPIWQRDYYEHIIRDDADLQRLRAYIGSNPGNWNEDDENPLRTPVQLRA